MGQNRWMPRPGTSRLRLRTWCFLVGVATLALPGCSGASTTGTTDDATTTSAMARLPTVNDLRGQMPSTAELQDDSAQQGGFYEVRKDRTLGTTGGPMPWATGVVRGFERSYNFKSVNEIDPMKLHDADAVLRALVFDTEEHAISSFSKYRSKKGSAVYVRESFCGGDRMFVRYDVRSQKLNKHTEAMVRIGSVVGWMLIDDNVRLDWGSAASSIAGKYARRIVERFPALATSTQVTVTLPVDFFSISLPDSGYLAAVAEGSGGTFAPAEGRSIAADDKSLPWVGGLLGGYERRYSFVPGTAGASPAPTMVVRALVFSSGSEADASIKRFEESRGDDVVSASDEDDPRRGTTMRTVALESRRAGRSQRSVTEMMVRVGALIVWTVIEDSGTFDASSAAYNMTHEYTENLLDVDYRLGC